MAANINIREKAKLLWIKSMKTIGNTAASIANNTKFKVDEMTLQNRRRELSGDLSSTVYSMWMKGTEFPADVTKLLEEMQELDDRLNDMRAEKYAQGRTAETNADKKENAADSPEETEENEGTEQVPEEDESEDEEAAGDIAGAATFVRSEIDECFDHEASVDRMAEKVNTSLDQLTDRIRSFSPEKSDPAEK